MACYTYYNNSISGMERIYSFIDTIVYSNNWYDTSKASDETVILLIKYKYSCFLQKVFYPLECFITFSDISYLIYWVDLNGMY